MKTQTSTVGRKTKLVLAAGATLLSFGIAAQAQSSLGIYFNLQTYGTVSAGSTIVDALGNTSATLNNDGITTITSAGLTSAGGGNSGNNGLTFAAGSLSSFTGSFTIQDWFTPALINGDNTNVVLYGGNGINLASAGTVGSPGPQNTYIGDGYTGVSTLIGFVWGNLVGGGGTGNPLGQTYNRYGNTVGPRLALTSGTPYDLVLTYDAPTYTFNEYVNGTLIGTLQEAFSSTSLAGVEVFGIGGAPGEPWSDGSNQETTSAFLIYSGALNLPQISALDAAGAGASVSTINSALAVPEPGTLALTALAGLAGLLFWRRSCRAPLTAKQ